ncbi:MAG TPA: hypothetical protein VGM80_07945, partial [Gaiellaceae bacterium]
MDDAQLAQRFGAIERQLRLISEHLGIPLDTGSAVEDVPRPVPDVVAELARDGHTDAAISKLRYMTGVSLLEAKRTVDALPR